MRAHLFIDYRHVSFFSHVKFLLISTAKFILMVKFSQSTVLRQFHAHSVVIDSKSDKLGKPVACQYPRRQDMFNSEAWCYLLVTTVSAHE